MLLDSPRSEPLDPSTCVQLLTTAPLGRVAVSMGALPSVVPVPFFTDGRTIVFPCATERLADAVRDTVVAFQCDGCEPGAHDLWSVLALGHCRISPGRAGLEAAFSVLWAGNVGAPVAELEIGQISGWRTRDVVALGVPSPPHGGGTGAP
jgi:hypothetical protein